MKLLILLGLVLLNVSCNEDSVTDEKVIVSYSMQCAGTKFFSSDSEENLCNMIADNSANSGCDMDFRKDLYNRLCPGQKFPHKVNSSRGSLVYRTYEFEETNCTTGKHFFYFDNASLANESYCGLLADDEKNNFCASSQRQAVFRRECG